MFSARVLPRSLPRLASRTANYSTRTAFRPSLQSPLRTATANPLRQPLIFRLAAFSTTPLRADSASQAVSVKLEHEISLEGENAERKTDSDSNVDTFLSQTQWEVIDNAGEQDVILKKTYEDETILVSFSIADFNTPNMYEGEDDAFADEAEDPEEMSAQSGGGNTKGAVNQGRTGGGNFKVAPEDRVAPADREELANEEDEYESQSAFPANVDVLITRASGKGGLRFNLVAEAGRLTVHKVMHLPNAASSSGSPTDEEMIKQLRSIPENDSLYTGPPFDQLDEEVQTLLEQYLDVRGLDTGLATFIPDYIDVKEQREYVAWLERVKGFLDA